MTNFNYSHRAFTLIELIIVIAIIVIMLAVSIPITANAIVERSLYNAAVQVQQDIRLAQQLAISHSSDSLGHFGIRFFPNANTYKIEADYNANFVTGGGRIITRQFNDAYGFPIYFGKSVPDSVAFGTSSVPASTTIDLNFNNLGDPKQGGGHINLINRSGTKQIQVVVSLIGRVRIEWVNR